MVAKYKKIVQLCMFSSLALVVTGAYFAEEANSATLLSAKTSLVVIDAEFERESDASPSESIDYSVTHYLTNVNYVPYSVSWAWGPLPGYNAWPPGSTSLTARIWAWRTYDGGKHYTGQAWDYIDNTTTSKHKSADVPGWIGTMISSLCDTNATCNARERTPIVFFPSLSDSVVGDGYISFGITPKDVGVFYQNKTQQFKAIAVTSNNVVVDLTDQVDWYIDPEGAPYITSDQDMTEGAIAEIDSTGKATINSTWGRVMVQACYPKGCGPNSVTTIPGANLLLLRNAVK